MVEQRQPEVAHSVDHVGDGAEDGPVRGPCDFREKHVAQREGERGLKTEQEES